MNIKIIILSAFLSLSISLLYAQKEAELHGWKLAVHAYSFKEYTFVEAVEKAKSLGLKYIEMYRNQPLGEGFEKGATTNFLDMDNATIEKIIKLLENNGLKAIAIGVFTPDGENEWIKTFEVAEKLGIEVINSEPQPSELPMIDRLASHYKIKVALHNHPKKSKNYNMDTPYWNPQVALDVIKSCGPYIGVCGDIKQWVRSGFDPLDCVKFLEGRFFSFHFNDVNNKECDAHDVPWGTGIVNIRGILEEMRRRKFNGIFSIEYAYNWTGSVPEIKKSIDYFYKISSDILK